MTHAQSYDAAARTRDVEPPEGSVLVRVPFATLLHAAVEWEPRHLERIADEMRREGVRRSVVVTYPGDDLADDAGNALLEVRVARMDEGLVSVALAPVHVHGYRPGAANGSPSLSVGEADADRLRAFLAFNA